MEWIESGFTKVCVRVDSEEQLLEVYQRAKDAGLAAHLITDSGKTEFDGVPTKTCCAIGPDYSDRIDKVTGHLELY
jgi:PTH2 family peptidyl-tRNA hydrolase